MEYFHTVLFYKVYLLLFLNLILTQLIQILHIHYNLQILYKNETVTYYREVEKIGKKKFLEFLGYNFKSNIEF